MKKYDDWLYLDGPTAAGSLCPAHLFIFIPIFLEIDAGYLCSGKARGQTQQQRHDLVRLLDVDPVLVHLLGPGSGNLQPRQQELADINILTLLLLQDNLQRSNNVENEI